jgi:hypothetical protein
LISGFTGSDTGRWTSNVRVRRHVSPFDVDCAVRRNREIAEARLTGETWDTIAARFGLSERQARRAEREHLAGVDELALDEDPAAVLREAIGVHRWALDRLAVLAERGDNSSARLGAIRSRVATSRDLVELLARAGLVPPTPYAWAAVIDVRRAAEAMMRSPTATRSRSTRSSRRWTASRAPRGRFEGWRRDPSPSPRASPRPGAVAAARASRPRAGARADRAADRGGGRRDGAGG